MPVRNKTIGRSAEWESYYTPMMYDKAKKIYGPFMQKWGYEFPSSWGEYRVSRIKQEEFRLVNLLKKIYMTRLRYNDRTYARILRKLRAYL